MELKPVAGFMLYPIKMGGSVYGGSPGMDGLFHGKSEDKMG
jgi:hypothetical protein